MPSTPPQSLSTDQPPSLPTSPLPKRPKTMSTTDFKPTDPPAPPPPLSAGPPLLIKKISPTARTPTRGSAYAAGYDLHSSEAATIPARGRNLVGTGLQMAISQACYGRVAPRSGLAVKNFIDTGAGVIDSDYRGEVKVLLFNHADSDFEVKEGDRIAQLIIERIYTPDVQVVEKLEESVRGAGGFGSTG